MVRENSVESKVNEIVHSLYKSNNDTNESHSNNTLSFDEPSNLFSLYSTIVENSNSIVYLRDSNGRLVFVNKAFEAFTQRDKSDLLGKTCEELFPGVCFDEFLAEDIKVISKNEAIESEHTIPTAHGNKTFITHKRPIRLDGTDAVFVLGICVDITERAVQGKKLESFVEQYSSMLENANVMFVGLSKDGSILIFNKMACQITGYSKEEILGKNWDELFSARDSGNSKKNDSIHSQNNQRSNQFFDDKILTKSGEVKHVSWQNTLYTNAELDELLIAAFGMDITELQRINYELKNSEERYRKLFEEDLTGDFFADSTGNLTDFNSEYLRIFEVKERNEIINKPISSFFKDPFELQILIERIKKEKYIRNYEAERITKKKKHIFVMENLVGEFDQEGDLIGFKGYVYDITERKTAEQRLIESEKRLIELNASKDKFFSLLAHDLRSPLSGFIGLLKMLRVDFNNMTLSEIQNTLSVLYRSSENVLKLLENLLEWSKIQTKRYQFNPEAIDLHTITVHNFDLLGNIAEQKNILLFNDVAASSMVFADLNMLNSIIRNLISNAIKFTSRGGSITVSVKNHNGILEFSVTDTGIGMTQDEIIKLCRIDATNTAKGTDGELGTGLGLIICKEFLELNDSNLDIESKVGVGSKFSFRIPEYI